MTVFFLSSHRRILSGLCFITVSWNGKGRESLTYLQEGARVFVDLFLVWQVLLLLLHLRLILGAGGEWTLMQRRNRAHVTVS